MSYHISYHIIYHIIPYHTISCHTPYHISYTIYHISYIIYHISYHISCHIIYHISYFIYHISYHIISYHIIYHIISYHIISYHIISYHIISYQSLTQRDHESIRGNICSYLYGLMSIFHEHLNKCFSCGTSSQLRRASLHTYTRKLM